MHVPKQTAFSGEENAHMCIWQHVTHETCVSSGQTGFQPWEGKVGTGSHAYQEAICNVHPLAKGKSFSSVEWYWVCQPYSGTGLMLRGAGQYKGTPWLPECCYGFWGWFFFIISLGVFFLFWEHKIGRWGSRDDLRGLGGGERIWFKYIVWQNFKNNSKRKILTRWLLIC